MRSLFLLAGISFTACADLALGQNAVDSVFIELYHSEPGTEGRPLVNTYRVYVDLAPQHELQMVYGDDRNPMIFHTTTSFINDTVNGGEYGPKVSSARMNDSFAALDSWITIVQACDSFAGIPCALDPDGSILRCPPYIAHARRHRDTKRNDSNTDLCAVDGLVPKQASRAIVPFNFTTSYLGSIKGNLLETTNGAWAVPGGLPGVTDLNLFLIGQFTTTGEFAYRVNLQVETPEHKVEKYVWSNADEGEFRGKGLAHGTYLRHPPPEL